MGKLTKWTQQEDQIIKEQVNKIHSRKWKNISKILLEKGFQRGEAECRSRYVCQLDPSLNKNKEITQEQLEILYDKYEEHGPKWCLIQNFIPNRNQIKIKNIFYGNIRLFLKKLYKFFTKKTAVFINELKTDDLQMIYDGTQQFKGFALVKKGFKKHHYKINNQNCKIMIESNKEKYFQLLNKILQQKTKIKPLDTKDFILEQTNFSKQTQTSGKAKIKNQLCERQLTQIKNSSSSRRQNQINQEKTPIYKSLSSIQQSPEQMQTIRPLIKFHQYQVPFYLNYSGPSGYLHENWYNLSQNNNQNINRSIFQGFQRYYPEYSMSQPLAHYAHHSSNGKAFELQYKLIGNQKIDAILKN